MEHQVATGAVAAVNAHTASCDRAQADACHGAADTAAPHPGWTLACCIAASSLAFIEGSVMNVALPAIGADLVASTAARQWAINAYLLPLSALLLIGGALGDRYGRRRWLLIGTTIFLLASLACALAPSLDVLLAARAAQGVGAALLMPNSLAILGHTFSGEAKGQAVGTWAAAGAIAGAIGPPLGGWLVDTVGWRAIFFINVPLAGAAIALARIFVRESRAAGDRALDWRGASVATLALLGLTWGLTVISAARAATVGGVAATVAGLMLVAAFVLVERRRGERAMMPLAMFGSGAFVGLTLLTLLLYGALGGLMLLLPYVLIEALDYAALDAGLALLPFAVVIGVTSRFMGRLAQRVGPRWPLSIGPAVTAIGFVLLTRISPETGYWTGVLPGVLVIAIGMAGAVAPLTTAVLSTVDDAHTGTASGFNSAIARTGGLLATAAAGAVMAAGGAGLIDAFHAAALIGAALALAAGAAAFVMLARR